jgi:hypothetical protein
MLGDQGIPDIASVPRSADRFAERPAPPPWDGTGQGPQVFALCCCRSTYIDSVTAWPDTCLKEQQVGSARANKWSPCGVTQTRSVV